MAPSSTFLRILFVSVAYCVAGHIGLLFDTVDGFVCFIWPASGVALGAMLLWGYRIWPGVFIGTFLTVMTTRDANFFTSIGFSTGSTLEAFAGAWILRRIGFSNSFRSLKDILKFALVGVMVAPIFSASIGIFVSHFSGMLANKPLPIAFRDWWFGDAIGILVVAPLILAWFSEPLLKGNRPGKIENFIAASCVLFLWVYVFDLIKLPVPSPSFQIIYVFFPFLIWAAVRYGVHGAVTANFFVVTLAVVAAETGHGPFHGDTADSRLMSLHAFNIVASVCSLYLAVIISEREKVEQALRLSDERFRQLADNIRQVFWVFDVKPMKPAYASAACQEVYGYDFDYMMKNQNSLFTMVIPEDLPRFEQSLMDQLKGFETETEFRICKPGNIISWISSRAFPIRDESGEVYRIVGISEDITQRKTNESALMESNKQLEEACKLANAANDAKSCFLANMSHEIRTPLSAIIGFANLLKEKEHDEDQKLGYLEVITRNCDQLTKVIDDILDISKVEAGKLEIETIKVSLPVLVQEIFTSFSLQAKQKDVELKVVFESDIPEFFETDPGRLKQILMNILGNAVKFTHAGHVTLKVTYNPETPSECPTLTFLVSDSGIGIPEPIQRELFQPFIQGDSSTTRSFGGTGLGLVLSRKLAKLLGGDVSLVESKENIGSTFSVRINCLRPSRFISQHLQQQVTLGEIANLSSTRSSLRKLRILVADENQENQLLTRKILESTGAEVVSVKDGNNAVNLALKENFDVLILDYDLTSIDGLNATRFLRSREFSNPIILQAAHAFTELKYRSLAAGCDAHLKKPISKNELLDTIHGLAQLH